MAHKKHQTPFFLGALRDRASSRLTLIHSQLPDDAGGRRHEQAWGYVLAAMTKRLSQ